MPRLVRDWAAVVAQDPADDELRALRRHEATGRPLGDEPFLCRLEGLIGRLLRPGKPGRKPIAVK